MKDINAFLPYILVVVILITFIGFLIYVKSKEKSGELGSKKRTIEQLPTMLSMLGVLGTFIGITVGLWYFDTNDLDASVPTLLDGMKTAFLTSLAGMSTSFYLGKVINSMFDNKAEEHSDLKDAAESICVSINSLNSMVAEHFKSQTMFFNSSQNLMVELKSNSDKTVQAVTSQTLAMQSVDSTTKDTKEIVSKKMDEFIKLLEKNNTEILAEAMGKIAEVFQKEMEKVTEEFRTHMQELIGRLVKESFDQLNESVTNMNVWQQQNKEMITMLTAEYKKTSENLLTSSESLDRISECTKHLIGEDGKLALLVSKLYQAMVDDTKFVEISKNLSMSAELSRNSAKELLTSTMQLCEWIQRQKNFSESVVDLIDKLDELNKQRDYNEEFWSTTRKGMNDATSIISTASIRLKAELAILDRQFYERLSATLTNLDICIQGFMKGNR